MKFRGKGSIRSVWEAVSWRAPKNTSELRGKGRAQAHPQAPLPPCLGAGLSPHTLSWKQSAWQGSIQYHRLSQSILEAALHQINYRKCRWVLGAMSLLIMVWNPEGHDFSLFVISAKKESNKHLSSSLESTWCFIVVRCLTFMKFLSILPSFHTSPPLSPLPPNGIL